MMLDMTAEYPVPHYHVMRLHYSELTLGDVIHQSAQSKQSAYQTRVNNFLRYLLPLQMETHFSPGVSQFQCCPLGGGINFGLGRDVRRFAGAFRANQRQIWELVELIF